MANMTGSQLCGVALKRDFAKLGAFGALSFLAACGGSSSTPPRYSALAATAATPAAVPLSGSAIKFNKGTQALSSSSVSGTLTRADQSLALNNGTDTFTSTGGPDGSGAYTGTDAGAGAATLAPIDTAYVSGSYDYVLPYRHEDAAQVSLGVAGYATTAGDMPTSGSATYQGEGMIVTNDRLPSGETTQHRSANTSVTVNFGAGTADVVMAGVTAPAAGATAVVDQVNITGATVSGAGFSGGTVTATLGGANALGITGGNDAITSSGQFYGYDGANGRPDEVAGTLLVDGNTGSLQAIYIAD